MIITIDGPTGSGKSSAARELAQKLQYHCISTGLLYRAIAYLLTTQSGYNAPQLEHPVTADLDATLDPKKFIYEFATHICGRVLFNGQDITPMLKSEKISQEASIIATSKEVRARLAALQRSLAAKGDVVLEGRDLGSVVFADADVKFYLTAELGERAKRWQQVQHKRGNMITFEEAKLQVKGRDRRDQERVISPLVIPKGATVIDNSRLNLHKTVEKMLADVAKHRSY